MELGSPRGDGQQEKGRERIVERTVALRSRWIYNLGKSGEVGAAYIAAMPEAAQGNG